MTPVQLRPLIAYNQWANARLLEAVAALSPEERQRDMRGSFTTVHDTLSHILWGERGWLQFWRESTFVAMPNPGDHPDVDRLRTEWARHDASYAAYLLDLTQDALDAVLMVDDDAYTLGDLITHVLNHSTYHRGQVTLLLRQLGHQPPETGYRQFLTRWRSRAI